MRAKRKGYDLVSLAIWAACVVVLLSVLTPKGDDTIDAAKRNGDLAQVNAIAVAVRQYKSEIGNYPPNLNVLVSKNGDLGPWLPKLPIKDAWGTTNGGINGTGGVSPYCYAYTNDGFAVWAIGKNKVNNSGGSGTTLPTAFTSDDNGVFLK
jgi:competence protein ComGC